MRNNQPVTNTEYTLREGVAIISRTDAKGIIIECNQEFIDASGYARVELIGKPHNIIRHPDMPEECFRDLWATIKRGRPWVGIVKNRRQNGDYYWVKATATPLPNGEGFTSVRTKPSPADIQAAEALYRKMREGEKIQLDEGNIVKFSGVLGIIKQLSIAQRLWMMALLPTLIIASLVTIGLFALKATSESLHTVYAERLAPINYVAEVNDLNQMALIDLLLASRATATKQELAEHFQEVDKDHQGVAMAWAKFVDRHIDTEEQKLIADHLAKRNAMWAGIYKAKELIEAGKTEQADQYFNNELSQLRWAQEETIDKLKDYQVASAETEYTAGKQRYEHSFEVNMLLGLFGALTVLTLSRINGRYISRRLTQASNAAGCIAAGNLLLELPATGKDEIGSLIAKIAILRNSLHELIASIRQNAQHLRNAASNLSSSAKEVYASSAHQSQASSKMAQAIQDMSASINQVGENAQRAFSLSQTAAIRSDEGGRVIHQTIDEMHIISDAVNRSAISIRELEDCSTQVSSIASVIKAIADQTNLLALNAAIEAARAGEQGRGFAVVADEVRNLAGRTSQSTQEIDAIINRIQDGTKRAAQEMEAGVKRVTTGVELASQAGSSVITIREGAEQASMAVNDISQTLKEQVASACEITQKVAQISYAADSNTATAANTSQAAEELESLSIQLESLTQRFRIS